MGLLDGEIARRVRQGLKQAGMYKAATLIKVTRGTRTPGELAAGTNPTTTSYACEGFCDDKRSKVAGTLVEATDRVVVLLGASLASGVVPKAADRLTIEGKTQNIISVERDPAAAVYSCLCRS